MSLDLLRVIDAGYRIDLSEDAWLREVAREAGAAFPSAMGSATWAFGQNDVGQREGHAALGLSTAHQDALTALAREVSGAAAGPGDGSRGLWSVATGLISCKASTSWRTLERLGVRDVLFATHADETGSGMALVWCKTRRARVTNTLGTRWGCVVRQLVRARAIRRLLCVGLGATVCSPADPPAGSARDARRLAALSADQAAELAGIDEEASGSAWRSLLDGRSSIVDRFESGGRRFLVARPHDPSSGRAVTIGHLDGTILRLRAKGLSLKVIATDLGLSISGVSRRLDRAMGALALRGPADLTSLAPEAISDGA